MSCAVINPVRMYVLNRDLRRAQRNFSRWTWKQTVFQPYEWHLSIFYIMKWPTDLLTIVSTLAHCFACVSRRTPTGAVKVATATTRMITRKGWWCANMTLSPSAIIACPLNLWNVKAWVSEESSDRWERSALLTTSWSRVKACLVFSAVAGGNADDRRILDFLTTT